MSSPVVFSFHFEYVKQLKFKCMFNFTHLLWLNLFLSLVRRTRQIVKQWTETYFQRWQLPSARNCSKSTISSTENRSLSLFLSFFSLSLSRLLLLSSNRRSKLLDNERKESERGNKAREEQRIRREQEGRVGDNDCVRARCLSRFDECAEVSRNCCTLSMSGRRKLNIDTHRSLLE